MKEYNFIFNLIFKISLFFNVLILFIEIFFKGFFTNYFYIVILFGVTFVFWVLSIIFYSKKNITNSYFKIILKIIFNLGISFLIGISVLKLLTLQNDNALFLAFSFGAVYFILSILDIKSVT